MIEEKREQIHLFNHQKRLEDIIDLDHPLVKLANSIDWNAIEEELKEAYPSTTGHPNKPIRLMVGLHYLRYMFNLSDEKIVWAYIENPYYQYFCGEKIFQHKFPIDRSSMSRFRERLKKKKLYKLLQETIKSGFKTKLLKPKNIESVVIDSTVQEKNITYPTDAKLYYKAIVLLSKLSKIFGIKLRQSYVRVGKRLLIKINRYNHAKQFKRKRAALKKLKVRLARVYREINRYIENSKVVIDKKTQELLNNVKRLLTQTKHSKNKLYSFNEPGVVCISKGKIHKRYEFGNKSSLVTTLNNSFILHCDAHQGNPYDGHTLKDMIKGAQYNIKTVTNKTIKYLFADKGYKGHNYTGVEVIIETSTNKRKYKELKKRSCIEAVFSHLKQHHRMNRNFLKGAKGDLINTVLSACGYNLKKIYNKFKKEYIKLFFYLFFFHIPREKFTKKISIRKNS